MNNFSPSAGHLVRATDHARRDGRSASGSAHDVLDHQNEFHVTYQHKWDSIVVNAEFMHWQSVWHFGEKQALNFMGAGLNYIW